MRRTFGTHTKTITAFTHQEFTLKIARPAAPVVSNTQPSAQPAPVAAAPAPAASRGWAPRALEVAAAVVELPFSEKMTVGSKGLAQNPRAIVAKAANEALDGFVSVAKTANDATKSATTNTTGRTETTPYKYTGALEVGLETLNRTFEGGGVDLKKAASFLQANAKLPDNK